MSDASSRIHRAAAYRNLVAWLALMSVITFGVVTCSRITVLLGMGGWSLFCLVLHLHERDAPRRAHRQRLRDALKKEATRPRYYEEPDHFFW